MAMVRGKGGWLEIVRTYDGSPSYGRADNEYGGGGIERAIGQWHDGIKISCLHMWAVAKSSCLVLTN